MQAVLPSALSWKQWVWVWVVLGESCPRFHGLHRLGLHALIRCPGGMEMHGLWVSGSVWADPPLPDCTSSAEVWNHQDYFRRNKRKIAPVQDILNVIFGPKAQELPYEMEKQKLFYLCSLCVCFEDRNQQNNLKELIWGWLNITHGIVAPSLMSAYFYYPTRDQWNKYCKFSFFLKVYELVLWIHRRKIICSVWRGKIFSCTLVLKSSFSQGGAMKNSSYD